MSMSRRPSASELLAWTLVGTALGVAAGFVLGEWLGPLTPARARRVLAGGRPLASGARLGVAETAAAARLALARDPELASLGLEPIVVGPGVVELHGWVPTRALRTRGARITAAADGIDTVVNCLLVRGEDDSAEARREVTDQPA
jgi:hypothetical protein